MEFIVSYKVYVSKNIDELSEKVAKLLQNEAETANNYFTVALSGGSTPKSIFQYLAKNYKNKILWNKIKFFWGDERCVPSDHPDSNYLMTKINLFDEIDVPSENIFAVNGAAIAPPPPAFSKKTVTAISGLSFTKYPQNQAWVFLPITFSAEPVFP